MGGRGASLAGRNGKKYHFKGKDYEYGEEYGTILEVENIKFVKIKEGSVTPPLETATDNRVYVTLDNNENPKYITFYDDEGKKSLQIDIKGKPHLINGKLEIPHVHIGYEHSGESRKLTDYEKKYVDKILDLWEKYIASTQ